jgi:hypothetical protein
LTLQVKSIIVFILKNFTENAENRERKTVRKKTRKRYVIEEKRQDKNRRERKVNMMQMIEENRRYSKTEGNIDDKAHGNTYRKKIRLKGGGKEENEKKEESIVSK